MNKIARIGMVSALLVAGCSMLERDGDVVPMSGTPCTHGSSGICVISVVVNSCTSISANPDVALVASGDRGDVVYEGALHSGSSLVFYLHRKFYIVNPPAVDDSFPGIEPTAVLLTEQDVFEKWASPQSLYLIIDQSRFPYWEARLTQRFHIFHQVISSGGHVVLSNQL